jgi:nicotinamidase-related amidase
MTRFALQLLGLVLVSALAVPLAAEEVAADSIPNRPKVPGLLRLRLRERKRAAADSEVFKVVERIVDWEVSKTAIIVIDMWDGHYCRSAAQRVGVMVPRMNHVLTAARNHGVMIIHAPSGTVTMYADTPYRKRMQQTPAAAEPPEGWDFKKWRDLDPSREPPLPVDTAECACDDPVVGTAVRQFSKQHPGLDLIGYDGVSDSGREIYNFFEAEGITNVILMGVHTNMCVLGRPFGIRAMVGLGRNVVLVRDLTDAMYDPRQPPHVSHTRGTELVIEHIEKHWCPTVLSEDLLEVLPGSAGPGGE